MYADWTDRIAAGEVPPVPPRPQGIERNLVLTLWEWGGPATFAHDELSTDKRNPTANANGPIYGVDWGNDGFLTLDPNTHTATEVRIPVLDPDDAAGQAASHAAAVALLGQRALLVRPRHHESRGDGHAKGASGCRRGFGGRKISRHSARNHPSAALAPQRVELPAGAVLRSADAVVPSGQHLLRYAPRAVRRRRGRDALRQRRVQRRASAGSTRASSTRPATRRRRKAGACRTSTSNGNGKIEPGVDRYVFEHFGAAERPCSRACGFPPASSTA